MKKLITLLTVLSMATTLVFASGSSETSTTKVSRTNYTFGGSSTVAPIANAAIPGFEAQNTDAKITYKRRGIKGAELASNATLYAYLWSEEIDRFSGLIVIDGTIWIDIKNMSGRDVFLKVDTKATGKCELAEKKF